MVMGACMVTPTVVDGIVGLHSQGYAFALLLVEIALVIREKPSFYPSRCSAFYRVGCRSTTSSSSPSHAGHRVRAAPHRTWVRATLEEGADPDHLAGGGFTAAHGLHLLQVWAYWGSLDARCETSRVPRHTAPAPE